MAWGVTWDQVGYYPSATDKSNSFQLVLHKVGSNGDFDAEFRYNQLEWTTGSASGGSGGLGGTPAQAGWDAGNLTNYQTLPGSRTGEVLNLVNTSNVSDSTPGLWTFSFRNGLVPGQSAANPIMPVFVPDPDGVEPEPGWDFEFVVPGAVSVSQTPLTVTVTVAVPEPEGYALALAGLGIVGLMGRRRIK